MIFFTRTRSSLFLLLSACAAPVAPDDSGESSAELKAPSSVEAAQGAQILGASADKRRVVYGTGCDTEQPTLRLFDDRSGKVTTLATDAPCMPGSVTFSADGKLLAFGNGQGEIRVHDVQKRVTKVVSRTGLSGVGVAFSPSSRFLVVATTTDSGAAALDLWPADLSASEELSSSAFFGPFGPATDSLKFSPDGERLVFLDVAANDAGGSPFPIGALTVYERATKTRSVIASGVPATSYALSNDATRIAYVRGVTPPAPPSENTPPGPPSLAGTLAVRELGGATESVIETAVAATPLGFGRCGVLLYGVEGTPGPFGAPITLKAFGGGKNVTLDANVFRAFAPNGTAVISPAGDAVAYLTDLDSMNFRGTLKVASLSACDESAIQKGTVASDAVPMTARFTAGGDVLAYLHAATSTMPGASVGTLAAFSRSTGTSTDVATEVTQNALATDGRSDEVRFVAAYDAGLAAGELRIWNATSGATRVVGQNAAVMTVQTSPKGDYVGFLSLTADPDGQAPPSATLTLARTSGRGAPRTVGSDVTSLHVGASGHVLYTTTAGVFRANLF